MLRGGGNLDMTNRFTVTPNMLIGGAPQANLETAANNNLCYTTIPNPAQYGKLEIEVVRPQGVNFPTGMFVYAKGKTILKKLVTTNDTPAGKVCRFTVNQFYGAEVLYINSASERPAKIYKSKQI